MSQTMSQMLLGLSLTAGAFGGILVLASLPSPPNFAYLDEAPGISAGRPLLRTAGAAMIIASLLMLGAAL